MTTDETASTDERVWTRSEGDQWDIVNSVGYTALGVAAFRAVEAAREQPLAKDDIAKHFVAAAGDPHTQDVLANPPQDGTAAFFIDQMAVRTKFFDEFFLSAAGAGALQAVILASGLDARAYRLDWPAGTVVFELDQPKVLEFKEQVTARHAVLPTAQRRAVAVDLRDDWPAALREAGFDPAKPTAWSAEGLLPYLPGIAQDLLFERVHTLSAPGSRFAVEGGLKPGDLKNFAALEAESDLKDVAPTPFGGVDISGLFYDDERADPAEWLAGHGWSVQGVSIAELLDESGRSLPEVPEAFTAFVNRRAYLTATR